MKIGILGFTGAGKRSIFRLLTGVDAAAKRGVVPGVARVRDPRVDALSAMYRPQKTKYAEIEFLLLPDVEIGGTHGAPWLASARDAEALCLVVRDFDDPGVFHPNDIVDARRDARELETELILADLGLVETRLERMTKDLRHSKDPRRLREKDDIAQLGPWLESEKPLRAMPWGHSMEDALKSLGFLSRKPLIVVHNTDREGVVPAGLESDLAAGMPAIHVNVKLELEVAAMDDPDERTLFLTELGIAEPVIAVLSRVAYEAAGLISFFTVGKDEVRAWTVRRGALAPRAAGKIHTDLERGFIRAEVVPHERLLAAGSEAAAKSQGVWMLKGKDYEVQDGDVMHVRFSV